MVGEDSESLTVEESLKLLKTERAFNVASSFKRYFTIR